MRRALYAALLPLSLLAEEPETPHKSPQEIQQELDAAEKQFQQAKDMFNPWYSGPLLTGSASMMPPGSVNIQPYIFVNDNFARYNANRHSHSLAHDLINLNPTVTIQTGLTEWMDTIWTLQGNVNWQNGQSAGGFGDMTGQIGLRVVKQGLWMPGVKVYFNQTFPTGNYKNLSSTKSGLEATGSGTYQTSFSLNVAKILLWDTGHPLSLRLSLNYYAPSAVRVTGFNAYGGGFNTSGSVHPGNSFKLSFGTEVSLTQRWVFANDLVYTTASSTSFNGALGTTSTGAVASMTSPSNDSLSLAPALEYNFNANVGILAGTWFTVYGRNSSDFISGILSVQGTF